MNQTVQMTAVVIALMLPACSVGNPEGRTDAPAGASRPVTPLPYALAVAGGQCPPDVAFYHAYGPEGDVSELGVVVSPEQVVSYSIGSDDPVYDGRSDRAVVAPGQNGHTFAIKVPMSAIVSLSVTASGNATEQGSTCTAAAL